MSLETAQEIAEARRYVERALAGISTLHLGPLDYNITTTVDDLYVAARILEQFGHDRSK